MPPSTRNRPTSSSSIKCFAKVVKNRPASSCSTLKDHSNQSSCPNAQNILGKRKRAPEAQAQDDIEPIAPTTHVQTEPDDKKYTQLVPETPKKRRSLQSYLPSPASTPSKRQDSNSPSPIKTSLSKKQREQHLQCYVTPPSTPHSKRLVSPSKDRTDQNVLPAELCPLLDLHGSFLKALTLHIAHHGVIAPIDINDLKQPTSRIWGVRKVTADDIRRCLGVVFSHTDGEHPEESISPHIKLFDYGGGRICIELEQDDGLFGNITRPFDEDSFRRTFSKNLHRRWKAWQSLAENKQDQNAEAFISQLPLSNITPCPSLKKSRLVVKEGQRRLEDLKFLVKNARSTPEKIQSTRKPCTRDTKDRCDSLFERLKAKEKGKASLPPPPTKAALDRKAALHRLPEVIQILSFSQAPGQRSSLSLPMAIERIQNSAKSSLSKDEVENCIKILAHEIGQGYITLVETGSVVAVVVDPARKPEDVDIWIQEALKG